MNDTDASTFGAPCPTTGCHGLATFRAEDERARLGAAAPYRCADCVDEIDSGRLPADTHPVDASPFWQVMAGMACVAAGAVLLIWLLAVLFSML